MRYGTGIAYAGLLATGFMLTPIMATAGLPEYQILDLGPIQGRDLNESGQVVGSIVSDDGYTHAVIWSDGELIDLGTLDGMSTEGQYINDKGDVLGTVKGRDVWHAFVYIDGQLTDIGTFGGWRSGGQAINELGQVTGGATRTAGLGGAAFVFADGQIVDLGTLGGRSSNGVDINNHGHVVGSAHTADGMTHAFLYQDGAMTDLGTMGAEFAQGSVINDEGQILISTANPSRAYLYQDGDYRDLGSLGRGITIGTDMNEVGQVVGTSYTGEPHHSHAFLYSEGTMIDLGTLGGFNSQAADVNNLGQVTGWSYTAGQTGDRAFVFDGGRMRELGTAEGRRTWGLAINDYGQILGKYLDSANPVLYDTFLATPIALLFERLRSDSEGVGPGKALEDRVGAAISHYEASDLAATCGVLDGYVQKVELHAGEDAQGGVTILQATADELAADAHAIRVALGCP